MSALRLATHPLRSARRFYGSATPSRLAAVAQATAADPAAATRPPVAPAQSAAALYAGSPLRNDWSREEIQAIYDSPFMDLMYYGVCEK